MANKKAGLDFSNPAGNGRLYDWRRELIDAKNPTSSALPQIRSSGYGAGMERGDLLLWTTVTVGETTLQAVLN
jgi:hypothetical protein